MEEKIFVDLHELHEDRILWWGRDFDFGKKHKRMPGTLYWLLFKCVCEGTTEFIDGKWVTKAECVLSQSEVDFLCFGKADLTNECLRYLEKNGYLTIVEMGDRKNSIHITFHDFGFFRFQPGDWVDKNRMKLGKFVFSRDSYLG